MFSQARVLLSARAVASNLLGPCRQPVPKFQNFRFVDGELVISKPLSTIECEGEVGEVEARVDLVGHRNEGVSVETLRNPAHISEVARRSTVEQRKELTAGEFERVKSWSERGVCRRAPGRGIDSEVDSDDLAVTRQLQPAERIRCSNLHDSPPAFGPLPP